MNLLIIIDLQNAFINKNTKSAINDIKKLISLNKFDKIIFTKFINNKSNPTYKKLGWNGCISKESRDICVDTKWYTIIEKNTYTAYNRELKQFIKQHKIKDIYLCGIDAECCVQITALNLFENDFNVFVLQDYIYSMHGKTTKNEIIKILKRNIWKKSIIWIL